LIKNKYSKVGNVVEVYVTQRSGAKHVVLMGLDDFERINQLRDLRVCVKFDKGTNSFYAKYSDENRKSKYFHRLIMNTPKGLMVDHMNHDTLDNRKINLRNVSHRENLSNQKRKSELSSSYVGVYWNKRARKWKAYIQINGKQKNLGYFTDELDAAIAYAIAYVELTNYGMLEKLAN